MFYNTSKGKIKERHKLSLKDKRFTLKADKVFNKTSKLSSTDIHFFYNIIYYGFINIIKKHKKK